MIVITNKTSLAAHYHYEMTVTFLSLRGAFSFREILAVHWRPNAETFPHTGAFLIIVLH